MTSLSLAHQNRLRAMADEAGDLATIVDLWARRDATDPEAQQRAYVHARRLDEAAALLRDVAEDRPGR